MYDREILAMNTAERQSLVEQASDSVFALLRDSLPEQLVYHNFLHTIEVVKAVEEIGRGSGLDDEDLEILALAAWFHDVGYTEVYKGHEERGAEMADRFLSERGYPEENISLVIGCILATRVPQRPRNILEETICDADLSHLGRKSFAERNELLRLEWELALGKHFTELEWANLTIDFLRGNPYHTRFAQVEWSPQRAENLVAVQNHLRSLVARDEDANRRNTTVARDLQQSSPIADSPAVAEDGAMTGIISRSHLDLVSTADTSANIMIAVSAVIIVTAVMLIGNMRGMGLRPGGGLMLPTTLLVLACLATMIGAVFVVRPNNRLLRLLQQQADDPGGDLQTLGGVVASKYGRLRVVYGIFVFGLLFAALNYILVLLEAPGLYHFLFD
ncbi:MAG: metal dependent phosphohydrolase [Chlorobi bacterium]|nr:metal dependent phosphohydrolase [Chlorobiota bacterium]